MWRIRPATTIAFVVVATLILGAALELSPGHKTSRLPDAPGAAPGWKWNDLPGYRFGHDEGRWNDSQLAPGDLVRVRSALGAVGARSEDVRVLAATQPTQGRFAVIAAAAGDRDTTCLAFLLDDTNATARCPHRPTTSSTSTATLAYLAFTHTGSQPRILAVVDGSVTRVELVSGDTKLSIYPSAGSPHWGTFTTAFGSSFPLGGKPVISEHLELTAGKRTVLIPLPLTLKRSRLLAIRA
jgi:hypothetical protein